MVQRTLLQAFHWYYPGDGRLWPDIEEKAASLADMGVTDVWLPPVYKGAAGGQSVGYDVYDLFDLGEFDQKGGVPTKYGDRGALERAAHALEEKGIGVIYDVVFNHKMGADETERVQVHRVNPDNREEIDSETFEATAHTRFTFPGRQGRYSEFIWDAKCFSGVDRIEDPDENGIFKLVNAYDDGWSVEVGEEFGNFDYLMGSDIEFRNKAVYEELKHWGRWLMDELPSAGFRLDAVKHIPAWFFRDWIGHMRESAGKDLFVVAEYWLPDLDALRGYLDLVDHQLMLFDVALHYNFHDASKGGADYDLRTLFDGTLVGAMPEHAVTLVANHDTQPLQSLEAPVEPWFKPLAYALILLREQGVPCVFHPDLYGAKYTDKGGDGENHEIEMPAIACLPALIAARQRFAHGPQTDIFDDPNCIAFVRHGTTEAPGCVVVMTNAGEAAKSVELGQEMAGVAFRDFLGHRDDEVTTDEMGRAGFPVNAGSVSVWVRGDTL
ncbi:alpha-amylase [Pleomorphomonas sp. NRK KF1]|uniref:alpha-amylase n=1 Tax=Pleomorphomonas sp. NRK KF1 TaxID=2943000 RepID=UPI002044384E|nr:alpha-amylase [Pleomorphomonas sp. NRK KF1]MCM5554545.1 alpha-amylase [Pleomorphomonas sp. NRK KF1]